MLTINDDPITIPTLRHHQRRTEAPIKICCNAPDQASRCSIVDRPLIFLVHRQAGRMNPLNTRHGTIRVTVCNFTLTALRGSFGFTFDTELRGFTGTNCSCCWLAFRSKPLNKTLYLIGGAWDARLSAGLPIPAKSLAERHEHRQPGNFDRTPYPASLSGNGTISAPARSRSR